MIRKIAALVIPLMLLRSCLGDLDPIPPSIDTYHNYYNYLLESYDLQWEIDDQILGSGHSYGIPAQAIVTLNEPEQEVLIIARNDENGQLIDSLSYTMIEYGSYMIALMGTGEDPKLICETLDTRSPSAGMVKFRILHTSEAMGPVDIYIGGEQPESLMLAEVDFTDLSDYLEASPQQLWNSIIVTPASILPADSTILELQAREFLSGGIYLCILEHASNSNESSFQMQVNMHPVY
jgi:hypothetical protein